MKKRKKDIRVAGNLSFGVTQISSCQEQDKDIEHRISNEDTQISATLFISNTLILKAGLTVE